MKSTSVESDPSTQEIVAATICHRARPNRPLEGSDLDAIRTAWRSAVRWPQYHRVDRCTGVEGGGHRTVLTTNFGDTLAWNYDSCGDYFEASPMRLADLHLLLDDQTLTDLGLPHS